MYPLGLMPETVVYQQALDRGLRQDSIRHSPVRHLHDSQRPAPATYSTVYQELLPCASLSDFLQAVWLDRNQTHVAYPPNRSEYSMVSDRGEELPWNVQPEQLQPHGVISVHPLLAELGQLVIVLPASFLRYIASSKKGALYVLQLQRWRQFQDDRVGRLLQPHCGIS